MGIATRFPRHRFFGKQKFNRTPKLRSVSRADTTSGRHNFEIQKYSFTKGHGIGAKICSSTFSVGGHDWRINCYLDGQDEESSDYISAFLYCSEFSKEASARAKFSFSLLEYTTGAAKNIIESKSILFSLDNSDWGCPKFIKRDILEASYLRDDSFTMICNVTVIEEPQTYDVNTAPEPINSSNLHKAYGTPVSVEKLADIIFEVDGKCFSAHSTVVASISSVFRAELSDMKKEGKEQPIKIDIEAPVFEALLIYIYTDELPDTEILTAAGMARHLFVAADRFGMDKLRKSCEKKLSEGLDARNVCTALVLAEQYYLMNLKSACLEYLSSPEVLVSAMATEGFIHLVQNYPNISKEISSKVNITKQKH